MTKLVKKHPTFNEITDKDQLTEEECIELKKEFYKFSEKVFFYGWVDDEAYELFNEVVILELEKNDAMN